MCKSEDFVLITSWSCFCVDLSWGWACLKCTAMSRLASAFILRLCSKLTASYSENVLLLRSWIIFICKEQIFSRLDFGSVVIHTLENVFANLDCLKTSMTSPYILIFSIQTAHSISYLFVFCFADFGFLESDDKRQFKDVVLNYKHSVWHCVYTAEQSALSWECLASVLETG